MIGITGGIASGKTLVSNRLRDLGAVVLDADAYAKKAVEPRGLGWKEVADVFPMVVQDDLTLNRQLLAKIIFADQEKRILLERIIHPIVLKLIKSDAYEAEQKGKIVFAEIPLLYEVGWNEWIDRVWVVYVKPEIQLERLVKRANISLSEAKRMIASQLPLDHKVELADEVIYNNGTIRETWEQIDSLWKDLQH